jgi:hypothetical protein
MWATHLHNMGPECYTTFFKYYFLLSVLFITTVEGDGERERERERERGKEGRENNNTKMW